VGSDYIPIRFETNLPLSRLIHIGQFCPPTRECGSAMCEQCIKLDAKIEHYRRITGSITDRLTIERINELIKSMTAEKAALHPERPS
jgi:hypothetical protein